MTEPRSQCTAAGVVQTVDTWYATTTDGDTVVLALPDAPAIWLVHRPHAQVYWQTEGRRGPDPLAGQRPPAPRDGAGPPPQPENGRGGPARCGGCGAPLRMGGDGGLLTPPWGTPLLPDAFKRLCKRCSTSASLIRWATLARRT